MSDLAVFADPSSLELADDPAARMVEAGGMTACRFSTIPGHVHERRDGRPTDAEGCHSEHSQQIADEAQWEAGR